MPERTLSNSEPRCVNQLTYHCVQLYQLCVSTDRTIIHVQFLRPCSGRLLCRK